MSKKTTKYLYWAAGIFGAYYLYTKYQAAQSAATANAVTAANQTAQQQATALFQSVNPFGSSS